MGSSKVIANWIGDSSTHDDPALPFFSFKEAAFETSTILPKSSLVDWVMHKLLKLGFVVYRVKLYLTSFLIWRMRWQTTD